MNKYFLVIRNTWYEITTYRLNFIMWRFRTVLQLLTIYFLWTIIIPSGSQIFGYTQPQILTYILLSPFITALVFATRTQEIGANINDGDLSVYLLRPINYFFYWFARDTGDKVMNMTFSIIELSVLYFLLRPPIIIQTNFMLYVLFAIVIILAVILQFIIGAFLGLIGFWSPEIWAPRFIYFILRDFLAGLIFPIDIFPRVFRMVMEFLPFQYLLYFPLKIYLGQISIPVILRGASIMIFWILLLGFLLYLVWKKGLKEYSAVGR